MDELAEHDLDRTSKIEIAAGLDHPDDLLDFADWLADHRDASRQEMMHEKFRLFKARHSAELN